jgi:hypothetical protein
MKLQISAYEWLARKFGHTVQTVEEEVKEEALLLERNILETELLAIKQAHETEGRRLMTQKILDGKKVQLAYMSSWLKRRSES